MSDQVRVVCGKCGVDPILTDTGGDPEVVCPQCGQNDKVDDAVRIGGEHFADSAARVMQSNARKAARRNAFMKFEAKPVPRRTFRWHVAS